MFELLHTAHPSPILVALGPVVVRWYGLLLAVGALLGFLVVRKLARRYQLGSDLVLSVYFYGLIVGFVGARLYHVLNEPAYYWQHPERILAVWQGGLAIHGGIIAGLLFLYLYSRRYRLTFWSMTDLLAPALILGQAIGRWGNYVNQELFGGPTTLPWGIPIDPANRPEGAETAAYFHPTFLYESLWNLAVFGVLLLLHRWKLRRMEGARAHGVVTMAYLGLYSVGRIGTELLRIDDTPIILGIRLPLLVSALLILVALYGLWYVVRTRHAPPQEH